MTDTPPDAPKNHTPFDTMSRRIVDNLANGFAGAFVLVPPTGDPVSLLILDDKADVALFWGTLKAKVDMALADLDAQDRQANSYGRR